MGKGHSHDSTHDSTFGGGRGAGAGSGDGQGLNFFDLFKPHHGKHHGHDAPGDQAHAQPKHSRHDGSTHDRGHERAQAHPLHKHLPDLTIDFGHSQPGSNDHTGKNHAATDHSKDHGRKHKKDVEDVKADTGLGSWGRHSSSSQAIAAAAAHSVGHSTYLPRKGSEYYGQHLPKNLGCTSASTNMFFDGLKAAGKVSDKDYKKLHQVGNDTAYASMQKLGIAHPVNGHDLKPGDWAYFSSSHRKHGHSGVVFEGKNGQLYVANNHSGTTIATPLSKMMSKYERVRGLRASL